MTRGRTSTTVSPRTRLQPPKIRRWRGISSSTTTRMTRARCSTTKRYTRHRMAANTRFRNRLRVPRYRERSILALGLLVEALGTTPSSRCIHLSRTLSVDYVVPLPALLNRSCLLKITYWRTCPSYVITFSISNIVVKPLQITLQS